MKNIMDKFNKIYSQIIAESRRCGKKHLIKEWDGPDSDPLYEDDYEYGNENDSTYFYFNMLNPESDPEFTPEEKEEHNFTNEAIKFSNKWNIRFDKTPLLDVNGAEYYRCEAIINNDKVDDFFEDATNKCSSSLYWLEKDYDNMGLDDEDRWDHEYKEIFSDEEFTSIMMPVFGNRPILKRI